MKFLVAGLGSVGQRHVRNLQRLSSGKAEILAWRVRGLDVVIDNHLNAVYGQRPEEVYGLKSFARLEEALALNPDAVIVTNPISLHVQTALAALKANSHVFIEKPLSNSWDGVEELIQISREKGLVTCVGYQMHCHPGLKLVKQYLDEGKIGKVISAQFHFGEYLPGMHPYEDYRQGHAARRDQGGGAILALSHELDTALWLFGMPLRVYTAGGHLSDLEIDVEDTASIILECCRQGRLLPVFVYLDFAQRPPRRFCEIVGDNGSIRWDYFDQSVSYYDTTTDKWKIEIFRRFDRNQLFLEEMENFLLSVEGKETPIVGVEKGAQTLRVALASLESMKTGQVIELSQ